jgi:hypothetical protein
MASPPSVINHLGDVELSRLVHEHTDRQIHLARTHGDICRPDLWSGIQFECGIEAEYLINLNVLKTGPGTSVHPQSLIIKWCRG